MNPGQKAGVFYWRKIAKGEKDKQLRCGAQTKRQNFRKTLTFSVSRVDELGHKHQRDVGN